MRLYNLAKRPAAAFILSAFSWCGLANAQAWTPDVKIDVITNLSDGASIIYLDQSINCNGTQLNRLDLSETSGPYPPDARMMEIFYSALMTAKATNADIKFKVYLSGGLCYIERLALLDN